MKKWILAITILGLFTTSFANTGVQQAIEENVPSAEVLGQERFSYFFWDVYDASLYVPRGKFQADAPFALKLDYLRDFDGEDIASRSIDEMKEQGFSDSAKLTDWGQRMTDIFPDVREGDSITGIRDAKGATLFFLNDQPIGKIEDLQFTQKFFDIWLSPQTSDPDFRRALLNL